MATTSTPKFQEAGAGNLDVTPQVQTEPGVFASSPAPNFELGPTSTHPLSVEGNVRALVRRIAQRLPCTLSEDRHQEGHSPLTSLQYSPMKKDALFRGAEVTPSSSTWGTEEGRGLGST